jgi:DNA-directed RNA polymerase subunit M/transcription elongation factor TFIIS
MEINKQGILNTINKKINFISNINNFYKAIDKIIKREMSDNEYMNNYSIMFNSKINQILYFSQDNNYKRELINYQNNLDLLVNFLEKYDYELFPEEWKNETIRLKTSIIENNISNTDVECPKCKQKNVYAITKQVRSGDEGATTFFTCLNCNNSWREE